MRYQERMRIFLSGAEAYRYAMDDTQKEKAPYLLQTFYDIRNKKENDIIKMLGSCEEFILDSGAFTFMNTGKKVHWKTYVDEYINFINKYDIKNFIELDLDYIKGIEETERIRRYIEIKTGKQTIPVWHGKTRNLQYFKNMCENYDYVALSTMETPKKGVFIHYDNRVLKQLVKIAHSYGTRVHGLGYMSLKELNNPEMRFDSIDASSWNGSIWGNMTVYKHGIVSKKKAPKSLSSKDISRNDYNTWIKICNDKEE